MKESADDKNIGKLLFGRGYNVEFDLFARLLNTLAEREDVAGIPIELSDTLGITHAKTQGLLGLARGFGLVQRKLLSLTDLGRLVLVHDPFFDDIGTLWLMHYLVAYEPRQLIWNSFTNEIVPRIKQFTMQQFREALVSQKEGHAEYSGSRHLLYETLTVIDAYTQTNFSRLAYLRADGDTYQLGYREAVPPLVLAACIVLYRDRHRPGDTALSVADILSAPNSPGVVLALDEGRLRAGLEQLKAEPGLSLESRADLDQVRITSDAPTHAWMERYYAVR